METITAIKTRRSVRNWLDKDVPDEILNRILDAGRWSPSPLNCQPWHFIVLKQKNTINKLLPEARHGSFLSQVNVVIIVTVDNNTSIDLWLSEHKQHIVSGACTMQNMMLAGWDLGIGSCCVTVDNSTTHELLEIPEDQVIMGSIALGYPKETPEPHSESDRKPLEDFIFYEKFGEKK